MNFIITSVYLDIKMFFKKYFNVVLLLALFSSVLSIIFIYSSKLQNNVEKINVAIVNEDTNPFTEILIGYITSDESFSQNINFSVDNMESAKSLLSDGKYDSIILIPDQFLNDIISGENKSFKSYMGNISSVEMIAINELLKSAAKYISSSQVGIYSTLDYLRFKADTSDNIYNQGLTGINLYFSKIVLGRKAMLEVRHVSSSGTHTLPEYYFLSLVVVFMLLYSMLHVYSIHEVFNNSFLLKIKSSRISFVKIMFSKFLSVFILNLILFLIVFFAFYVGMRSIFEFDIILNIKNIILMAVFLVMVSLFAVMSSLLFNEKNSCYIFILIATIAMTFISGGFIPSAFLPEIFDKLKLFTINYYCIWLLSGFFSLNVNVKILIFSNFLSIFMVGLILFVSRDLFKYNKSGGINN